LCKQNNIIMENTITISLDESKIDNLHNEVKISKKLLTINNLINNIIEDQRTINESKHEIRNNLNAIEGFGWDLSWEKSNKIIRDKTARQLEIENDIFLLRNANQWQRDFIKELKDSIKKRKNILKTMGVL